MIRKLIKLLADEPATAQNRKEALPVAVACLLVEAAMMDGSFDRDEEITIRRLLKQRFGIDDAEADGLIDEAEAMMEDATELWKVAHTVKEAYSHEERVGMIEMLWEVVYADGKLDDYEANLLRRVAGLIYVPDAESGAARRRVRERLGLED